LKIITYFKRVAKFFNFCYTHIFTYLSKKPPSIECKRKAFLSGRVCCFFCGKGTQYGHPHQETLALLQNLGINIYRIDLNGIILVETNDTDYQVFTEKESIRAPPIIKSETKTSESQEYKYAASKNSEVFHYFSCSCVPKITPENIIRFKTREEVIASGRRPCKKRTP